MSFFCVPGPISAVLELEAPAIHVLAFDTRAGDGRVPLAGRKKIAQRFSAGWRAMCNPSAVGTAQEKGVARNPVPSLRDSALPLSSPRPEGRGYPFSRLRRSGAKTGRPSSQRATACGPHVIRKYRSLLKDQHKVGKANL
jgi:hypothetical protein